MAMGEHAIQALVLVMAMYIITMKEAWGQPKEGCSGTCGNLSIPYPFGTTIDCCLDESFLITCNLTNTSAATTATNNGSSSQGFLGRSNGTRSQILDVSLAAHELRVLTPIAIKCYDNDPNTYSPLNYTISNYMPTLPKFPISSERNKFTTVGCYAIGYIQSPTSDSETDSDDEDELEPLSFANACGSFCTRIEDVQNGTCANAGCCQTPIPKNLYKFSTAPAIEVPAFYNRSVINRFSPCGYSFVVEEDAFNFSSSHLHDLLHKETVPLVLDWAVGNVTCEQAETSASTNNSTTTYACLANNSECHDSKNGPGYQCSCTNGYQGNPYLLGGCQDINECEVSNPCITPKSCENLLGGVSCSCPKGHKGDGMRNGAGCSPKDKPSFQTPLAIALGICICLLVLFVGGSWTYWRIRKRKLIQLKEKFFLQNGGILLQQNISGHKRSMEMAKIFSAEELKKATNNYDESKIIGQGGNGTVYKGVLQDNKVVAIKKSKICDQSQIEQFINEVIVLSQINHRNVVKLLGCCLETEVPLLVYEFITNGTLSSHIHIKKDHQSSQASLKLPWEMRLKIATEIAGALAYLHSETCMPIIHRDVKTANILLDDNFTAKVADFGASRLIPIDQTPLATLVQGTLGYLDPEYFQSSQLTEKSDVYGFGVVLAELLTGKEAVFYERPECRRNLAKYFVSSMEDDRLLEIIDDQMAVDVNLDVIEQLEVVASLAKMCLREKGEERPAMKELAIELEGLLNM